MTQKKPPIGWLSDRDLYGARKPVLKLIVVGDGGVGKTTLIHRYLTGVYLDQRITVGSGFATRDLEIEGLRITLSIWDFAGEKRFRFMMPRYCQGAHGCLLAFDLTRQLTFRNLSQWLPIIRDNCADIPILLVGTKLDIVQVYQEHPHDFVEKHHLIGYMETSSKANINVTESFELIANYMLDFVMHGSYKGMPLHDSYSSPPVDEPET
jgi:small GTP-binding protein